MHNHNAPRIFAARFVCYSTFMNGSDGLSVAR
jgi:hypothetical protein